MPFLTRRDVAVSTRTVAEKKYRDQLRRALSNPGLTAEQKHELRRRLDQIGKSRVYDAASPPPAGAIQFTPPEPVLTEAGLRGLKKAALVALARERGLSTSGSKAALVARLLSH